MDRLFVTPAFREQFSAWGWQSSAAVVAQLLGHRKPRGEVWVKQATLPPGSAHAQPPAEPGADVFFKLYDYGSGTARFLWRPSKARREFENYRALEMLGIPAAERIACGEERDRIGRLRRAFILTRAVPRAETLLEFHQRRPPAAVRARVGAELASMVRRLHAARFYYYDLVWRNILVSDASRVVFIDCPRGGFARFGQRRRSLRDLASLDKSAVTFCRRTERLRFLLQYLAKPRLDDEARQLARACLDYRRTRWPDDWRGV